MESGHASGMGATPSAADAAAPASREKIHCSS